MSNRWNVQPFALLSRLKASKSTGICAYSFHYFQSYFSSSLVPHQCPLSGNMNKLARVYETRAHSPHITQKKVYCCTISTMYCLYYNCYFNYIVNSKNNTTEYLYNRITLLTIIKTILIVLITSINHCHHCPHVYHHTFDDNSITHYS